MLAGQAELRKEMRAGQAELRKEMRRRRRQAELRAGQVQIREDLAALGGAARGRGASHGQTWNPDWRRRSNRRTSPARGPIVPDPDRRLRRRGDRARPGARRARSRGLRRPPFGASASRTPSSPAGGPDRPPRAIERAVPAVDAVVYAVAAGSRDEGAYRRAYVDGVSALLEVLEARAEPPRRVFFVSSTSVYGERGGEWIDETAPLAPRGFAGESLAAGERRMLASPIPATVVRFAGIYGPGRGWMIERARAGASCAGDPPKFTNRIHRDDCAGVLAHLVGSRRPVRRRVHRGRRRAGRRVRGPGMARGPAPRPGAAAGPRGRGGVAGLGQAMQQRPAPGERLPLSPSHLPRGVRRGARGRRRAISVNRPHGERGVAAAGRGRGRRRGSVRGRPVPGAGAGSSSSPGWSRCVRVEFLAVLVFDGHRA